MNDQDVIRELTAALEAIAMPIEAEEWPDIDYRIGYRDCEERHRKLAMDALDKVRAEP